MVKEDSVEDLLMIIISKDFTDESNKILIADRLPDSNYAHRMPVPRLTREVQADTHLPTMENGYGKEHPAKYDSFTSLHLF
jgi:hypothetical protein